MTKPKTLELKPKLFDQTVAPAHPQVAGRLVNIDRELALLNKIFSDPTAQISQTDALHLIKTLTEFEALRVRLIGRTAEAS